MVEIDLRGKAALVTGGSRGIGKASAMLLARAGCGVAVGYRGDSVAAGAVVAEIRAAGGGAFAVAGDVGRPDDCGSMVEATLAAFGRIDLLLVNAGIWKRAPIERMTPGELEETLDVNLKSAFYLCRRVVEPMRNGGGNIILVASTAGQRGEAHYSHYAASKGALIALTKSLAAELGPLGIRVNCVAPGWVRTDMTREVFEDDAQRQSVQDGSPLGRAAEADDIAGPILFLASDLARHVHGEILNVNGGSVLCG